jgi:hypothetical protein
VLADLIKLGLVYSAAISLAINLPPVHLTTLSDTWSLVVSLVAGSFYQQAPMRKDIEAVPAENVRAKAVGDESVQPLLLKHRNREDAGVPTKSNDAKV